jgi:hypothetical protein
MDQKKENIASRPGFFSTFNIKEKTIQDGLISHNLFINYKYL